MKFVNVDWSYVIFCTHTSWISWKILEFLCLSTKKSGKYVAVLYCSLHPAFLVRCEMVHAFLCFFLFTYPGFLFFVFVFGTASVAFSCNQLKLLVSVRGTITVPGKLQLSHNTVLHHYYKVLVILSFTRICSKFVVVVPSLGYKPSLMFYSCHPSSLVGGGSTV